MNNDTIKLLNLEDINVDLEKSDITKINNILYCNIVLTAINEHINVSIVIKYFMSIILLLHLMKKYQLLLD